MIKASYMLVAALCLIVACSNNADDASKGSKEDTEAPKSESENDMVTELLQFKLGERHTYTGGTLLENKQTKTNGLYLTRVDNNRIEYSFSELLNWEKEFEKKGTATLISNSDYLKIDAENEELSCKFKDSENELIILITINKNLNETKAAVFNDKGEQVSALMFNK